MALPLHLVERLQLGAAGRREVHLRRRPRLIRRGRLRRGHGPGGRRWGLRRRALAGPAVADGAFCTTRAAGIASSRTTVAGSRSSSIPLKAAWRSSPSRVQSVNSARITIRGSTQRASGSRGFLTSGASGRRIGSMAASSSLRIARIDAAAHLAGVAQAAIVVDGHDQRAQVLVGPLPGQPPHDHDLLLAAQLDLQPVPAAAPGLVRAEPALGHDPLQSLLGGRLREVDALAHDVRGVAHQPIGPQHAAQQVLAVLERDVDERSPVEVQQVEDHVGHAGSPPLLARSARAHPDRPAGWPSPAAQPGLLLQPAERRPALLVEGDHLAVHDRLLGIDPAAPDPPGSGSRWRHRPGCASRCAPCRR